MTIKDMTLAVQKELRKAFKDAESISAYKLGDKGLCRHVWCEKDYVQRDIDEKKFRKLYVIPCARSLADSIKLRGGAKIFGTLRKNQGLSDFVARGPVSVRGTRFASEWGTKDRFMVVFG